MTTAELIIIAIGLSMDSFVVSIVLGIRLKKVTLKHCFYSPILFAIFQAIMPLFGWLATTSYRTHIAHFDHWIAFILLGFIGGKLLYSGIKEKTIIPPHKRISLLLILYLAFATSIDALAVGISFAVLSVSIIKATLIIFIMTVLFSIAGLYIGVLFGRKLIKSATIFGGFLLIAIGVKILISHLLTH